MHLRFAQIRVATSVCTGGRNCPPDSSSAMGSSPPSSHLEKKKAIPVGMTFSFLASRTDLDTGVCIFAYPRKYRFNRHCDI